MTSVIARARMEGRYVLMEPEAKRLCIEYGIPVPRFELARSVEEAVEHAERIGYPVVLKVVSPQVVHKTDVGGVFLNVSNREEVREAYRKVVENTLSRIPSAEIVGVLVEEQAEEGAEVIVGAFRDSQFGPTVMFGLGGVFVEVLDDVSFRVAPVSEADAEEMIREIRGYRILRGYRGRPPADLEAVKEIILKVSRMATELREIREVDLNPIYVYEEGAVAVDVKIILEKA